MYTYTKEQGFTKITETKISNVIDVTYIEISRDGSKIAILLPEPTNALKILDYLNNQDGVKFKEILSELIISSSNFIRQVIIFKQIMINKSLF